jgi:acetolactate synthase-1/2/3 large subunit
MLREYVKWDYELRNFTQLEAVVDRALEIAMTEPRGPIYLTLPREVLGESHEAFTMSAPARRDLGGRLYPDPQSIEAAAAILAAADNPLIITGTSGRHAETVGHLVALAESFAIPVVEFNRRYLCFPTNHPLHLGFAPEPFIETADVVWPLTRWPWFPAVKSSGRRQGHSSETRSLLQCPPDP